MTSRQATSEDLPAGPDGALRVIGLAAVCIGVAALAAATFVLSYQGIRAVALQAGIEPRYARGYPLLIDAMLVIVLAAVLALRGAGVPSRMLAWLTLLVVLCAAAGADTLHATGRTLPHNAAVVTAAVLPWALVFVAFVLLLAMLRHARLRRHASAARARPSSPPGEDGQARSQQSHTRPSPLPVRSPQPRDSVSIVPGFTSQLVTSAAAGAAAGAAVADVEPLVELAVPDDAQLLLADTALESTAVEAAEPTAQGAASDVHDEAAIPDTDLRPDEGGSDLLVPEVTPTAQADEAAPHPDEPAPLTDVPAPLTDVPSPLGDEAEPHADEPAPLTDVPSPHGDEAEPHADVPAPLTDVPAPQADEAEPRADEPTVQAEVPDRHTVEAPHTAADDPGTGEAPAQSDAEDDMPVFRRIRSSPTPPED